MRQVDKLADKGRKDGGSESRLEEGSSRRERSHVKGERAQSKMRGQEKGLLI